MLNEQSKHAAWIIARCRDEGAVAVEATEEAEAAWAAGRLVAAGDLDVALGLPIDIVVEASGHPEAGAVHALASLRSVRGRKAGRKAAPTALVKAKSASQLPVFRSS